jgi:hypothetical protein
MGWLVGAGFLLSGCASNDERLVRLATDGAERQAAQSRAIIQLQEQVAEGTKQLVASDAEARREWIELRRELQVNLAEVGQQRDTLEAERRSIAADRHRDPILAAAIETCGLIVACLVPLLAAVYALRKTAEAPLDASVATQLIHELQRRRPTALAAPPPKRLIAADDDLPF